MEPSENPVEENRRLRQTMRDLVALSTLPAIWIGLGPEGIARSLADVLLNTLSLDLIYVRLKGQAGEGVVEVARGRHGSLAADVEAVRNSLAPLLESESSDSPATIADPSGAGTLHVAITRFGVSDEDGVLVTASRHSEFPTERDRVLLSVGASQTAIVLQRLQAEKRQHEQREWLRVTVASIGDAVIATNTEGRITFLNSVAEELTGWTSGDAQGKPLETVFAILNEQTSQPIENPVEKVLREGGVVGLGNHTVLLAKDGTRRPIDDSAAPIRDAAGNILGVVLIFRDVTEQRRAEQELRASEARKSAILGTALDCIITMDHEGRVVEFNPAAERTFGYSRGEVIGRELADLIIPPSLRERHHRGMAHYLATGEGPVLGKRLELPALRADGSEFPVELAITRFSTEGPPLFTAYLRDISEQTRAEQHRNARLAVTQALAQAASIDEAAGGVLQAVCENLGWDVGFFWTVNDQQDALVCRKSWHGPDVPGTQFEAMSCKRTFAKGEGLPGHVWSTGESTWLLDVTRAPNFPRAATAADEGLHSAFACPVAVGEKRLGVIEFFTQRIREPDEDLLELMGTMAGTLGQFIKRKTAEDELRQSEQELSDFFDNATVGLHWVGPDGVILRANQAELDMLGYAPDEYIGRSIAEFHADEEVIRDILKRLTAGEKLADYPARVRCKDGSIKDVLIDSSVLWKDGQFNHTRCFTRDVTERKQIEKQLEDARSRLDSALEAGEIVTWTWDIPNNRLFTDENLDRLFNLASSDAGDGSLDKYIQSIHPDDWPKVSMALDRSVESGDDYEADYRIVQPDGSVRWVIARGRVEQDESGRAVRMPGVLVDITDRKQLEDELRIRIEQLAVADRHKAELLASLRASEEKLRLLADTIPQLAWMARPDGHIFWYNRRWYEYTGTTLEQMEGWGWQSVHDPDVLPKVLTQWKGAIASGQPFEMVFPLKGADGTSRPFLTRVNPLRDENGRILYWCGTNTDISDIKRMEEALREADRRKDEFLATLAHELRNPLAPIRTGLEVMKLAKDDPATVEEIRHTMERQTQQLITLVDDLLDVSRITRGKLELRKCRVKLADVVQSAVEASKPIIDESGQELSVAIPDSPIYLDADPHRLAQVLSNLLNNAAKYTPVGDNIWLAAERQGSDVVLSVRDDGLGIPAEMLDRIFEMFAQIERPMEKGYTGLGIGLTLVKSLVEMHGGRIEVHSDGPGCGSTFIVRLPVLVETPDRDRQPERPGEQNAPHTKRRVLVVDDNGAAAKLLGMVVRMLGHEVRTASDGRQGVELAAEYLPDVVLMDLGMPRMNGYEAAQHIRRQPWGERMMLVALTGWGQEEDKRRTKEAGFDRHLVKPAEPSELQALFTELDGKAVM